MGDKADAKLDPRWLLTGAALVVLGLHLFFPELLDETALVILAVAALPWFGAFVSSFKAFGLEAQLREIKETANKAKAVAEDAAQQVELETPMDGQAGPLESMGTGGGGLSADLFGLADTYVATRRDMPSGSERTAEMTRIFRQMMAEARRIGPDQPMALEGMEADDPGRQLASVAYAYEMPGQATPEQLIGVIARSQQPFVQYWGLMALRKLVKRFGVQQFTAADLAAFNRLEGAFHKGTDRAFVYEQIQRDIGRA